MYRGIQGVIDRRMKRRREKEEQQYYVRIVRESMTQTLNETLISEAGKLRSLHTVTRYADIPQPQGVKYRKSTKKNTNK